MDLTSLWIGDHLRIKSSGKEGVFAGVGKGDKARVKHKGKILLVESSNIEIVKEDEDNPSLEIDELLRSTAINPRVSSQPQYSFTNEIDLHIEKLNRDLEHAHPQLILDHQLLICRAFIKDAISKKKTVVTVIHGKGTGILKEEVLFLLKEYKKVRFSIEVNNGGAQEVWFRY